MYCAKCGNKINEGDAFCAKCGNQLNASEKTPKMVPPASEKDVISSKASATAIAKKRRPGLSIVLVVALLLVSAGIYAALSFIGVVDGPISEIAGKTGISDSACLTFSSRSYFTILAEEPSWDGTLEYSVDSLSWTKWDGSQIKAEEKNGTWYLFMRGTDNTVITGFSAAWKIGGTSVACRGNIETLLDYKTVIDGKHPTMGMGCYSQLFADCTGLTTAPDLPATTLAEDCYHSMFAGCTSLKKAPKLSATKLASGCYRCMFYGCTSLKKAPELPATILADACYNAMFCECTSLKEAPKLPATKLVCNCYDSMFSGCTSLTIAPELPATELDYGCYSVMFQFCTSLKKAPELPATRLADCCYQSMFNQCESLEEAPELPARKLSDYCYEHMFSWCSSLKAAPELPATELAPYCYSEMFLNCTSLEKAPELPTIELADYCYQNMFSGCTSLAEDPTAMYQNENIDKTNTPNNEDCTKEVPLAALNPDYPENMQIKYIKEYSYDEKGDIVRFAEYEPQSDGSYDLLQLKLYEHIYDNNEKELILRSYNRGSSEYEEYIYDINDDGSFNIREHSSADYNGSKDWTETEDPKFGFEDCGPITTIQYEHEYDISGRKTSKIGYEIGDGTRTVKSETLYNDQGKAVEYNEYNKVGQVNRYEKYTYDEKGNLLLEESDYNTIEYTRDKQGQLLEKLDTSDGIITHSEYTYEEDNVVIERITNEYPSYTDPSDVSSLAYVPQLIWKKYSDSDLKYLLTEVRSQGNLIHIIYYKYDENGNLVDEHKLYSEDTQYMKEICSSIFPGFKTEF